MLVSFYWLLQSERRRRHDYPWRAHKRVPFRLLQLNFLNWLATAGIYTQNICLDTCSIDRADVSVVAAVVKDDMLTQTV